MKQNGVKQFCGENLKIVFLIQQNIKKTKNKNKDPRMGSV